MITGLFLGAISSTLDFVLGFFPRLTLPDWVTHPPLSSGVADEIGGLFSAVKSFLPVDLLLSILATACEILPAVGLYVLATWVWKHLPTIAGFGLGSG